MLMLRKELPVQIRIFLDSIVVIQIDITFSPMFFFWKIFKEVIVLVSVYDILQVQIIRTDR
jgi:hypothetical protein